MNRKKLPAWKRRGLTAFQTAFILGVIGVGVIAGAGMVGQTTDDQMDELATDVANPADLTARFSGDCDD